MPDASLPFSRRLATALYAAALLVTAPPGALARSAPEPAAIGFDVPAGDLAPALRALASQAGIMLTFTPEQTAGKTTAGLKGRYGIEEAFARLLAGSQLQATRQSAGGYILRAAEAATLSAIRITGNAAEPPSQDTGAYTAGSSKGATGLSLSLRETPQSVSIITRQQMSDFQLNNINQVLDATPGVVVERVETDRSYYTARGFNITTFQEDGIGAPFAHGLVAGDLDSAIYDRVEVVRGANGLLSNTGNPSAIVNFVRKRPAEAFQASAGLSLGSWNTRRLEADVSSPLNASGSVRGRVVAVGQDGDSYLDRYHSDKRTLYAIFEADVSERDTLSAGYTYEKNKTRGQLWGGLPLYDSAGMPTHYGRSTNTAADWSRWNTETQSAFVQAVHRFDNDWQAQAVYTHREIRWDGRLFSVFGLPDPVTGLGVSGLPGSYDTRNRQDLVDVRASGPFDFLGRRHEAIVGLNYAISRVQGQSWNADPIALPPLQAWDGDVAEPAFDQDGGDARFIDRQRAVYAALRLSLTDRLTVIGGLNALQARSSGQNYGTKRDKSDSETTPYAGLVYDINDWLSAYASYTEIFTPQSEVNAQFQQLEPVRGRSYEAGLKAQIFEDMLATLSFFKAKQSNLANFIGMSGDLALYDGTDVKSQGVELELAGSLTERLQLVAGYTRLSLQDAHGAYTRPYTPREMFRLSATYRVPGLEGLKLGASLNWRSRTYNEGNALPGVRIAQPAYALLNLMARYDISRQVFVAVNVNNVTDKKALTSRYWADQGYYGAPRNALVSLNWKY